MDVLVIGSGGREHAICHSFSKSPKVKKLYCAPGNAGIAAIAECVPIKAEDVDRQADFAAANSIDLTFVGGETSLVLGIVDEFEDRQLRIVGPSKSAARLEGSKAFAKDFMAGHSIPTALYKTASSPQGAVEFLEAGEFGDESRPVVVKADGLAAGKGVVVAKDRAEAIRAVGSMADLVGSDAASTIVLEECLVGNEVSLLAFCDGVHFALMPPTRDHKRIGEGDTGPNTGGMGTITNASLLTHEQTAEIIETTIKPTLTGCREEGFPFRGILFLGLMMTVDGPRVLEYNVRFGDPEAQSILVRLETDLVDVCEAMLTGTLDKLDIKWRPGSSATVVLAAKGYPKSPQKGDPISGVESASRVDGVRIFHAGTSGGDASLNERANYVTSGGRVLGVTAVADDLDNALAKAYSAVELISWDGMRYRRDIGK
ncbi:MAG TPA: phosphoribosylamine--glycine ligase [Pyrinomonadaceae bacterium]|nr:phosphoribosylamine--glycine ligase [Pyrinomonadaceae bacterium]